MRGVLAAVVEARVMSVGPNNGFSVILGIASLRHSTDTVRPQSMLSPLSETCQRPPVGKKDGTSLTI